MPSFQIERVDWRLSFVPYRLKLYHQSLTLVSLMKITIKNFFCMALNNMERLKSRSFHKLSRMSKWDLVDKPDLYWTVYMYSIALLYLRRHGKSCNRRINCTGNHTKECRSDYNIIIVSDGSACTVPTRKWRTVCKISPIVKRYMRHNKVYMIMQAGLFSLFNHCVLQIAMPSKYGEGWSCGILFLKNLLQCALLYRKVQNIQLGP